MVQVSFIWGSWLQKYKVLKLGHSLWNTPYIYIYIYIYIYVTDGTFNEASNISELQGMGKEVNSELCPRSIKRKRQRVRECKQYVSQDLKSDLGKVKQVCQPTRRPGTSGVKICLGNKPVVVTQSANQHMQTFNFLFIKTYLKFLKTLLHVSVIRLSPESL